eukprot:7464284-Alexandrium_andersonii.AAC.1
MHVICNGGVANVELQQFVRAIVGLGYTLQQLDDYVGSFRLPGGLSLSRTASSRADVNWRATP